MHTRQWLPPGALSLALSALFLLAAAHPVRREPFQLQSEYCPNNDTTWAAKNVHWKSCLQVPCFEILNATANASCATLCAPLWEANNRCLSDDCSFALAQGDPRVCPINRYIS